MLTNIIANQTGKSAWRKIVDSCKVYFTFNNYVRRNPSVPNDGGHFVPTKGVGVLENFSDLHTGHRSSSLLGGAYTQRDNVNQAITGGLNDTTAGNLRLTTDLERDNDFCFERNGVRRPALFVMYLGRLTRFDTNVIFMAQETFQSNGCRFNLSVTQKTDFNNNPIFLPSGAPDNNYELVVVVVGSSSGARRLNRQAFQLTESELQFSLFFISIDDDVSRTVRLWRNTTELQPSAISTSFNEFDATTIMDAVNLPFAPSRHYHGGVAMDYEFDMFAIHNLKATNEIVLKYHAQTVANKIIKSST